MPSPDTPHVFISYSSKDTDLVDGLKAALAQAGVDVWLDHEQLTPGEPDWRVAVLKGIEQATTVIYSASPDAASSKYVAHELAIADGEGKTILPFWIRGEKWYFCAPMGFYVAQYIDARGAAHAAGLANLLAALGVAIAAPAPARPATPAASEPAASEPAASEVTAAEARTPAHEEAPGEPAPAHASPSVLPSVPPVSTSPVIELPPASEPPPALSTPAAPPVTPPATPATSPLMSAPKRVSDPKADNAPTPASAPKLTSEREPGGLLSRFDDSSNSNAARRRNIREDEPRRGSAGRQDTAQDRGRPPLEPWADADWRGRRTRRTSARDNWGDDAPHERWGGARGRGDDDNWGDGWETDWGDTAWADDFEPWLRLPAVPKRLLSLGFRGVNVNGTPAIVPPKIIVSAGSFLMGSYHLGDREPPRAETPLHHALLESFHISKYQVTVAEYALAVQAGAVREPPATKSFKLLGIALPGVTWKHQLQRPDHPVVNVSWRDANGYVAWLRVATGEPGWRLPTEAEWEKAARLDPATKYNYTYPWGDTFDLARCNTLEGGVGRTMPVGSFPASDPPRSGASPWGVEEMAGNVWEWTSSLFRPYPYTAGDGREDQDSADNRVLRGGAWSAPAESARAASRRSEPPDVTGDGIGFRLAFSPHQADKAGG